MFVDMSGIHILFYKLRTRRLMLTRFVYQVHRDPNFTIRDQHPRSSSTRRQICGRRLQYFSCCLLP